MTFAFDFLVLLCFELGNNFAIRPATCQLIPIAVVVILTIRKGFRDCTSTPPPNRLQYPIPPLVFLGAPLLRVVYRDGESLTISLSPRTNNGSVRCRLLSCVTR